ncbi:MAG: hypothetical protein A2030_00590 [Chloroflexi bacterium RBG_19FT_COMBO_50_10]|nr:MAG: hypothetical protein A2030_00590 [Chloroflexi bacterium RBG_19FT_COMBO_50_10]
MINIKILSYKSPQRYAVKRTLLAALNELHKTYPDLKTAITEVKELSEMEKYTAVVILPSLVVNEKLVCVGRFPSRLEVDGWLRSAIKE